MGENTKRSSENLSTLVDRSKSGSPPFNTPSDNSTSNPASSSENKCNAAVSSSNESNRLYPNLNEQSRSSDNELERDNTTIPQSSTDSKDTVHEVITDAAIIPPQKSQFIAYFLWFIGGFYGLHLLYLERDSQAWVQWATLGGGFGFGVLRDFFRIPDYVSESNRDRFFIDELVLKNSRGRGPPIGLLRWACECILGYLLNCLLYLSVPTELLEDSLYFKYALYFTLPLASAIGIYVIANIGHQQCDFRFCLLSAYLTNALQLYHPDGAFFSTVASSSLVSFKGAQWQMKPPRKRNFCHRISLLTFFALLYLTLWGSAVYYNMEIQSEGKTLKVRDAIKYFFKSQLWTDSKKVAYEMWILLRQNGFRELFNEFQTAFFPDPMHISSSFKTLGLDSSASQEEVTAQCRKLSRKWHPDRHKGESAKKLAEDKFIQIREACDMLSTVHSKRRSKNLRSFTRTSEESSNERTFHSQRHEEF